MAGVVPIPRKTTTTALGGGKGDLLEAGVAGADEGGEVLPELDEIDEDGVRDILQVHTRVHRERTRRHQRPPLHPCGRHGRVAGGHTKKKSQGYRRTIP